MMKKIWKKRKGFTLVELLIVVAIIGILSGIAIPSFLGARTKAKISRSFADMRTMANALELYYSDNNYYPTQAKLQTDEKIATTTTYLASIPKDPFSGTARTTTQDAIYNSSYGYHTNSDDDTDAEKTDATVWVIIANGPDNEPDITTAPGGDDTWETTTRVSGEIGGETGVTEGDPYGYGVGDGKWWDGKSLTGKGDIGRGGP